jgi:hypothetical protein
MSTSSHRPRKSMTSAEVQAWLRSTKQRYVHLHARAAEPLPSDRRDELFLEVSALLQETVETVGVIRAALHGGSQTAGRPYPTLLAQSTQLMDQCTALLEHTAPGGHDGEPSRRS